jgi:hypothetical protein
MISATRQHLQFTCTAQCACPKQSFFFRNDEEPFDRADLLRYICVDCRRFGWLFFLKRGADKNGDYIRQWFSASEYFARAASLSSIEVRSRRRLMLSSTNTTVVREDADAESLPVGPAPTAEMAEDDCRELERRM